MSSTKSVITAEQANLIASRACDDDSTVQVVEYHLEAYSKDKLGFLGSHQKLEMSVRQKGSKDLKKLNFFVKALPRDSEAQMEFVKQHRVFNQEAEFFMKLMPRLLEAVSVGEIETWAPQCYFANDDLVVLEDVRDKGFSMREAKIFSSEELKSAARAMARMHAASIITENKLGKPLNELYPQACAEQIFNSRIREYGLSLTESLIVGVAKRENRRCKDVLSMIHRAYDFVTDDGKHRVVCHGDAWPNNVMMDNGKPPKCLLVDYQMTRYASRMFDVAQLVCLSTYRDIDDKDEKSVVKAYWEELCETLRKCLPTIDRPTYEQLIQEYDEAKHSALFIAVMYLPTILLSKKVFAEYKGDPVLYQKFIFRRDNNCIYELMDQDEEYGRRITETVLAFMESGEKIAAK